MNSFDVQRQVEEVYPDGMEDFVAAAMADDGSPIRHLGMVTEFTQPASYPQDLVYHREHCSPKYVTAKPGYDTFHHRKLTEFTCHKCRIRWENAINRAR